MSQGAFEIFKYQTSEVTPRILPIRLQPETISDADNPEPAAGFNGSQRVKAPSGNRRRYGIHCRYVTISRTIGTPDGPFTSATVTARIPLLTSAARAAYITGSTTAYGGTTWTVGDVTEEKIR